ncbi:transcriptional regulator [Halobacillus halophilus]|uniref:HTH domain protein n=1 Tax=Halobacillus halophilus (strain ATCC 35676 / DSM 2266 / JCM 20832 / KCTC 3685 / LMG 17431 / NBRC 102448 / NCIMB 2269) TaxID=866895 RepID=I0JSD2_HALH3|nr:helix-turn-helix transcriptional regulator [Halobacillus halophilus]ASF40990.1 transcriptional regulator [Halobacillus halophilus]CCG47054.1 HTH domain protein [Halobacillus halophilus DSM 2266]
MMRTKMRQQREKLNLSQQKVADTAGLTRVNYSSIERGRTEPNIEQMIAIAKALKVTPDVNFFEDFCDVSYQNPEEVI